MNNKLSHLQTGSPSHETPAPVQGARKQLVLGSLCVLPVLIGVVWFLSGSNARTAKARFDGGPAVPIISTAVSGEQSINARFAASAAQKNADSKDGAPSAEGDQTVLVLDVPPVQAIPLADKLAKEERPPEVSGSDKATEKSTAQSPDPADKHIEVKQAKSEGFDPMKKLMQSNPGLKHVDGGYAPPMPMSKIQALDGSFPQGKIDWASLFTSLNKNITPDSYTDKEVLIPLVIGIRMCDGVMAIRLKNAEWLKECGDDIEALAKALDVPENELAYARAMKDEATKGNWLAVFENLGILQKRVTVRLQKTSEQTSTLVMIGGWMQGARFIATAVQNLKDTTTVPSPSYVLREPKLVEWLLSKLKVIKSSNEQQKNLLSAVQKELASILAIVSIDIDPTKGKIEPNQLALLITGATAIVDAAVGK